jgi:virginiamycin B lyase
LVTSTENIRAVAVSGTHIYWTAGHSGGTIGRANLDGSDVNHNFITGLGTPRGIAVDGAHIYWADLGTSMIGRAKLDGSEVDQNFIGRPGDGSHPVALAVDRHHIYWSDQAHASIVRADIDGHDREFIRNVGEVNGIAVDGAHIYWSWDNRGIGRANLNVTARDQHFIDVPARGVAVDARHIYWAQGGDGSDSIGRANLDGSALDASFIADVRSPKGVAVGPLPHPDDRDR